MEYYLYHAGELHLRAFNYSDFRLVYTFVRTMSKVLSVLHSIQRLGLTMRGALAGMWRPGPVSRVGSEAWTIGLARSIAREDYRSSHLTAEQFTAEMDAIEALEQELSAAPTSPK